MPKYIPFQIGIEIQTSLSDMIEFRWHKNGIIADFIIPRDELNVIRVQFDEVHVVRILDEMPLSTEAEPTPNEGLVPDHFAYRVEGALFWQSQSDALKTVHKSAQHYRFITGWACLDVIASFPPAIVVVPSETGRSRNSIETLPTTASKQ
jgi:hypothetical protein